MLRINLGCGPHAAPGWVNCDLRAAPWAICTGCWCPAACCVGVPDLERALSAYLERDRAWFFIPDNREREKSLFVEAVKGNAGGYLAPS